MASEDLHRRNAAKAEFLSRGDEKVPRTAWRGNSATIEHSMSKRAGLLLFAAFAALFLTVNRDAYRGYFQDDEIDNLSWTPYLGPLDFLKGAITPQFQANNFRPVGHYYFHAVEEIAGLDFPVYAGVLQAFHLLNVWLLWLVARRLGAAP